jgi:predicted DsbA family dithiol-disulfide isomerase
VVYFNFPLDKDCNEKMSRSVYPNSCIASKAMIQAAYTGNFTAYLLDHFKDYKSIHENYNKEKAISFLPASIDRLKFEEGMKSMPVTDMLKNHIEFAEKIGVQSTPTMFISGRRMSGAAPKEMMEAVIKKELEKVEKK